MENAILPLSADPLTLGHIHLIKKSCKICRFLTIAILENNTKKPMFSLQQRLTQVKEVVKQNPHLQEEHSRITIVAQQGLLATLANQLGIFNIIRGVRTSEDLNYEGSLEAGHKLQVGGDRLTFIYLRSSEMYAGISATLVKSIFKSGGNISPLVPLPIKRKMENVHGIYKIIVSGCIASGKSYITNKLADALEKKLHDKKTPIIQQPNLPNNTTKPLQVHTISFDKLVANVYKGLEQDGSRALKNDLHNFLTSGNTNKTISPYSQPYSSNYWQKVIAKFGSGKNVIKNYLQNTSPQDVPIRFRQLQKCLAPHIHECYAKKILGKKGVFILEMPMAAEYGWLHESNMAVVLVEASEKVRKQRLQKKKLPPAEVQQMLEVGGNNQQKLEKITAEIQRANYGNLFSFKNENSNINFAEDENAKTLAENVWGYFFNETL